MSLTMGYSQTDEFSSQSADDYIEVRKLLAPEFQDLATDEIEDIFYEMFGDSLTAEDVEFSFKKLGRGIANIGRKIAPVAAKIAPVAGAAIGTAIAPGAGTAIGGALGSVAGQALYRIPQNRPRASTRPPAARSQPRIRQSRRRPPSSRRQRGRGRQPSRRGVQASPAAAQLTALLANPQVQRSLLALLMGSAGRQSIRIAGESVPVGALASTLEVYARAAAEEHAALQPYSETASSYLLDDYGEFLVDPASQEERAALIYELVEEENRALLDSADNAIEQSSRQYFRDKLEQFYQEEADLYFLEDEFEEEELELIEDDDVEFDI